METAIKGRPTATDVVRMTVMGKRKLNVKCFAAFIAVTFLSFFVLLPLVNNSTIFSTRLPLLSNIVPQPDPLDLDEVTDAPPSDTLINAWKPGQPYPYKERQQHYHNTLDLDYFHFKDFQKEPPANRKYSSETKRLRAKIIRAERAYMQDAGTRTWYHPTPRPPGSNTPNAPSLESLDTIVKHTFQCPFSVQDIGDGKWICGFELYSTEPKAQECVVYTFGGDENIDFEKEWMLKTDCKVFKFQFNRQKVFKNTPADKQIEIFPELNIGTSGSNTLRSIMKNNDHGWLDVLVLDINESVYEILRYFVQDFKIQILPFAQLIVKFPVNNQNKFVEMFKVLEEEGLRPFHVSNTAPDKSLQFSFFNLRGKHLLLVGSDYI